jgi:hypothetical protein
LEIVVVPFVVGGGGGMYIGGKLLVTWEVEVVDPVLEVGEEV